MLFEYGHLAELDTLIGIPKLSNNIALLALKQSLKETELTSPVALYVSNASLPPSERTELKRIFKHYRVRLIALPKKDKNHFLREKYNNFIVNSPSEYFLCKDTENVIPNILVLV